MQQLTLSVDNELYQCMELLLAAAHGLSVEEYLEGHLLAYWKKLNSKGEAQEQFTNLEMVAHYLYHEMSIGTVISEEELQ